MGGSILPTCLIDNKLYFLFGKEKDTDESPGWADFGGGTEKGETLLNTAIREGSEELTGFLGSKEEVKKMLTKNGYLPLDYHSIYKNRKSIYRAHLFLFHYDPLLPFYYNNNHAFLENKLNKKILEESKIFEKVQIKWFSMDEVKQNIPIFRSFYQNIVKMLLQNESKIRKFIDKSYIRSKKLNKTIRKKHKKNISRKNKVTNKINKNTKTIKKHVDR